MLNLSPQLFLTLRRIVEYDFLAIVRLKIENRNYILIIIMVAILYDNSYSTDPNFNLISYVPFIS